MPKEARSVRFPGARVTGNCKLPKVGAGNWTWILYDVNKYL